jgi:6-phosphogluconolactonase (cycloisomerase 2 family)
MQPYPTARVASAAGGTSTCYLTIDKAQKHMLLVNYWDSTIGSIALEEHGLLGEMRLAATISAHACARRAYPRSSGRSMYDPKEGRVMKAAADAHVDHTRNDAAAQAERQGDPHSHAIVLDPAVGNIAYVPDLGMDMVSPPGSFRPFGNQASITQTHKRIALPTAGAPLRRQAWLLRLQVRQFHYDVNTGRLTPAGSCPSGQPGSTALGPRYLHFHPTLRMTYVVNELSSEIAGVPPRHFVACGHRDSRLFAHTLS